MRIGLPPRSTTGSSMPRNATKIGFRQDTWSDFLESIKEDKRLGHERKASRANNRLEEGVMTSRGGGRSRRELGR